MEFFNFGLKQKLEQHSCVEFHSDSDGDGFNFPKPQLEQQTNPNLKGSRLESNLSTIKTLSYDVIITLRRPKVGTFQKDEFSTLS